MREKKQNDLQYMTMSSVLSPSSVPLQEFPPIPSFSPYKSVIDNQNNDTEDCAETKDIH
jgi:hypothetical protein